MFKLKWILPIVMVMAAFAAVARRVDTAPSVDARNRAMDRLPLLTSRQPLRQ